MEETKYLKRLCRRHDQKGTTLVELIVTFALMGIFMTAAVSMLTSTLRFYTRIQSTSKAVMVSDMLLDKISGEISAAKFPAKGGTSGYYVWLDSDGERSDWIAMENRGGSPIAVFAAEADESGKAKIDTIGTENQEETRELFIRYYALENAEGTIKLAQMDWHYDRSVYMDYSVDRLEFSREHPDEHPDVIRIDITLRNVRTGFTYSTFRFAENYNDIYDGKYLCKRNDGKSGLPERAGDFAFVQYPGDE